MTRRRVSAGDELWLESHGARIVIRSDDVSVLQRFPLPFKAARASPGDADAAFRVRTLCEGAYEMLWGDESPVRFDHATSLLRRLGSQVDLAIAEHATEMLFVHAGVVGLHGVHIAIPGPSGSGKTTLVREAIGRGATFFSDEYAVVDAEGRVHPYRRPLNVRQGPEKTAVDAVALGAPLGRSAVAIDVLLFCRHQAEAQWHPTLLAPGEAVMDLVANTVAARARPSVALERLTRVAAGARAWKGVRGEAGTVLDMFSP